MSDDEKIDNNEEHTPDDMVDEVVEDFTLVDSDKESKKTPDKPSKEVSSDGNFLVFLAAAASDLVIEGVLTAAVFFIVDFIMRLISGYYIAEKATMAIILYAVVALLYVTIMHTQKEATVGEKVFGLKISKN